MGQKSPSTLNGLEKLVYFGWNNFLLIQHRRLKLHNAIKLHLLKINHSKYFEYRFTTSSLCNYFGYFVTRARTTEKVSHEIQ